MKKKEYKRKVQEVLDEFDFIKVGIIMQNIDHKWVKNINGELVYVLPTEEDMKKTVKRLFKHIRKHSTVSSSGGFTAERYFEDAEEKIEVLRLTYIPVEISVFSNE